MNPGPHVATGPSDSPYAILLALVTTGIIVAVVLLLSWNRRRRH